MTAAPDVATLAAGFAAALHEAGLPVTPERAERFARAVLLIRPETQRSLRQAGLATLVSDPAQIGTFDAVFAATFSGIVDPAEQRGDPSAPPLGVETQMSTTPAASGGSSASADDDVGGGGNAREVPVAGVASAAERPEPLHDRDFASLSPAELLALADAMRRLRVATPPRRTRRFRPSPHGDRVDLRATLRAARGTSGHPTRIVHRARRTRPRRLVVLCDVSGSMEPYARALLQLLWCASGGSRAEVFGFATRLTRLTSVMARQQPQVAIDRAVRRCVDWAGGSRIGDAIARFTDVQGRRGMARGAVVLVISDGWDTGDPARLAAAMERLSRVAHRVVWANPRTASPHYRPLAGGMAAAWPYCDAVVSAHSLDALDDLLDALADVSPGPDGGWASPARPRRGGG
ncbi:VWA domain-containing protein [Actinomycetospora endophytica]|uniref:VWA domain-containing protein n=1 Tax=Actinomycetospora endophytica TaxID=2291215 RepID=A0ABS8PA66_9PSEU|nr:VWA domain-containing protein [Actinomycetospora endophytica]MCD2195173.1 VWA domain-containing protein [Actinomycetospora endophytica]